MEILDRPNSPGYYWWRGQPEYKWHLAKVYLHANDSQKLYAEFFGEAYRYYGICPHTGNFYGEWVKAVINEPDEKEIEHV